MIRIGLLSNDRTLQSLLSSALGRDMQVKAINQTTDPRLIGEDCDVLLLDLHSTEAGLANRLDFFQEVIASGATTVLLVDDALRSTAQEFVSLGAFGSCRRPPAMRDLKTLLQRAFENATLRRKVNAVTPEPSDAVRCDSLIGTSAAMREVFDLIHRVAGIKVSVLITGDSGTGKELIARAIHNVGGHSAKPFVAVSCGAIPETLIEAELFGHEKGAFTGSTGSRVGLMEQAEDGTLFLDEIAELSLATQVKLLRVLQQREFSRLGSNKLIPLRARLVFATHQNLADLVAQGRFRQDLYFRINVMHIPSPALQDRPEDVPMLAQHFLSVYSALYEKPMDTIELDAIDALRSYAWPGNVRELENTIQRALVVASGTTLRLSDLPAALNAPLNAENVLCIDEYNPTGSFERQLRNYKVRLAVSAVQENGGNKTEAARSLQISRAYLHRLLRLAETEPAADGVLFSETAEAELRTA